MSKNPVELFAGIGLGITHSSLGYVPEVISSTKVGQAQLQCRININNGNLFITDHVCAVMEPNGPLAFAFHYNSQQTGSNSFWHFSLDKSIAPVTNSATVQVITMLQGDGHQSVYTRDPNSGFFLGPKDANGRGMLRFDENNKEWVHYHTGTQQVEIYDGTYGLRESVADPMGRKTRFLYDVRQQLREVIGYSGISYEIQRNNNAQGTAILIVEIRNELTTILQLHQFDQQGRLAWTQTSENGYIINYHYLDESGYLRNITQTDGTEIKFGFLDTKINNIGLTNPQENNELRYEVHYPDAPDQPIVFIDSNKIPTKISVNTLAQVTQIACPRGDTPADQDYDVTTYRYLDQQLQVTLFPDDSQHQLGYEPYYGMITSEVLPDNQHIEYHFEENTDRPKKLTEVHWLVEGQYPLVTRYVYDNNWDSKDLQHTFLRFKISPGGAVSEYRPDNFGNVASLRQYTKKRFDRNFAPPVAPSLDQMTEWVEQLLDKTQISLVEMMYDSRGQVQKTTTFTEIEADGKGHFNDRTVEVERYWNRYGAWTEQRVRKTPQITLKTRHEYNDSLQRMTKEINALTETTEIGYLDTQQQQKILYINGRASVKTFNSLQKGVSETESASSQGVIQRRNTKIYRDFGGRPIKTLQTDGKYTYQFFDRQQRLRFSVSRTGIVIETQYYTKRNFQIAIQYADRVNVADLYISKNPQPEDLPSLERLLRAISVMAHNPKNRQSYTFFNKSQQPRFQVDANRYLVESRYDHLGRAVAKIQYATALTADQLKQLVDGLPVTLPEPDFSKDRVTQTYYDQDSNPTFSIDPAGYVTANQYDGANRLQLTTCYHNPITNGRNLNSLILPTIEPNQDQDATTYYQRDPAGRIIYTVDPEGCVSFNTYFASGKIEKTRNFVNKVDSAWYLNPASPPIVVPTDKDEILSYTYDDLLRVLTLTNNNGRVDQKAYDNMGNLLLDGTLDSFDPNSKDATNQRRVQSRFDGWNQTVAYANAYVSQYMLENPTKVQEIWDEQSLRGQIDDTGLKLNSTDPRKKITRYIYDEERRLIITIDPRGAITEVILNIFGESEGSRQYDQRIPAATLDTITGGVITSELRSIFNSLQNNDLDIITVNDRNLLGQIEHKTDGDGNQSIYFYNAFGQVWKEQLPVNSVLPTLTVTHEFEPRGLETGAIQAVGSKSITTIREYKHYLGKQTAVTNALNHTNRTGYDRNGLLKTLIDALGNTIQTIQRDGLRRVMLDTNGYQQSIRHDYDHPSRLDLITYPEADTTKVLKNSVFGQVINASNPYQQKKNWGYSAEGSQASFQAGDLSANKNSFDLNGLLETEMDHNGVITDYKRDASGNIERKTLALGELDARVIVYTSNSFNREITRTNALTVVTTSDYFKTGPLKQQTIDPGLQRPYLNLLTINAINAQGQLVTQKKGDSKNSNEWDQKINYDEFGRKTGVIIDPNGLALSTSEELNLINKPIKSFDANGNQTLHFYDDNERERFTVYADGAVKEVLYDVMGREKKERAYAIFLTAAEMNGLQSTADCVRLMATKITADDSVVWKFYNSSGAIRFTINAIGCVKEQRYDKAQREVVQYNYANPVTDLSVLDQITTENLAALMSAKGDLLNDRITYTLYNGADQPVYTIDAEGYIIQHIFDANNNEIETIKFAIRLIDPKAIAQLPIDRVPAAITQDINRDQYTYSVYNHHNQLLFSVDGELAVTKYDYDEVGNRRFTTRLWTPVAKPSNYADLVSKLAQLPTNVKDRTVAKAYDHANRVWQTTDEMSKSDTFVLNSLGDVHTHTDRMNNQWEFIHDRARRVTDEISPLVPITVVTQDNSTGKSKLNPTAQTTTLTTHYGLDNNGNQLSMTTAYKTPLAQSFQQKFNVVNKMTGTLMAGVPVDNGQMSADFINRPEEIVNIESHKIYDSKGRVVVEQADNGAYVFHVRDSAGNVRFVVSDQAAVVEFIRNSFGEVVEKIEYFTKLSVDLSKYTSTGIPIAKIQATPTVFDRHTITVRDRRGGVILTKRGPTILYSVVGPNDGDRHVSGNDYCQVAVEFDAFEKPISQKECVDPVVNLWTEKLTWYDRNSNEVASALKCTVNSQYYLTLWQRNSFGEEAAEGQYKSKITAQLNPKETTLAQLAVLAQANQTTFDRHSTNEYNLCGKLIKKTLVNVTRYRLSFDAEHKATVIKIVGDVSTSTDYNALQLPETNTLEDGSIIKIFYDARGKECARTGVKRTTTINNQPVALFPLTATEVDVQGREVVLTEYANGAMSQDSPVAKSKSPADHITIKLRDSRGLVLVEQDPVTQLTAYTYTRNKKLARSFQQVTNTVIQTHAEEPHVDQKLYHLNSLDQVTGLDQIRDGLVVYTWTNTLNTFGDVIQEGDMLRAFDNLGRAWMHNQKGVSTIYGYNGLSDQTLVMVSASRDLSKTKPEDLLALLQDNSVELERTEMVQDLLGHSIEIFDPVSFNAPADRNITAENLEENIDSIPLAPVFNQQYLDMFTGPCLTWIFPQERIVQPSFTIWPTKDPSRITTKEVIVHDITRAGVDVSDLPADLYNYAIKYTIEIPNIVSRQLYFTEGQVQIDTRNVVNSLSLVAIVENGDHVRLSGNTKNLSQVELVQNGQTVATLSVHNNNLDLSSYQSGTYKLKPVGGNDADLTLPFTIFTRQLPAAPLAREIPCKIALNCLENYGQLLLSMPSTYLERPVKIVCAYIDDADKPQSEEITIADVRFFDMTGPQGFAFNFKFANKVKSVSSITLSVQDVQVQWLLIVNKAEPMQGGNIPRVKVALPYHQISSHVNYLNSLAKNYVKIPQMVDGVITANFAMRQVVHIESWPALAPNPIPIVEFKDMTFDRLAEWRGLDILGYTQNSITIDVTAMQPCQYPFRVLGFPQENNHVFDVSGGGQVYPCSNFLSTAIRQDHYTLLTKLAPRPVNTPPLSGRLPNGDYVEFDEFQVRADADSGFTSLGVSARDVFADFLLKLRAEKPGSMVRLHEEIFSALSNGRIAPKHPDIWLKLVEEGKQKFMSLYAKVPAMIEHYIQHYRKNLWLGYQSALLYAEHHDVTLHVWRRSANSEQLEYLGGHNAADKATRVVHMLLTHSCTHFNLLVQKNIDLSHPSHRLQLLLKHSAKYLDVGRRHRTAEFDRWSNAIKRGDADDQYTLYEYDDENRVTQITLPSVDFMSERGDPGKDTPVTKFAFNLRGYKIFEQDPNGHTTGYVLNEACQLLQIVDGTGLTITTQVLDIFGDSVQFSTSYGLNWENTLDCNRRCTKSKQPDGLEINNVFNEKGQLKRQTSTGGKTSFYNYGVNGDVIARVDPGQKVTLVSHDRNHQKLSLVFPAPYPSVPQSGGQLVWTRDYFGNELTHTNLSGTVYHSVNDYKQQPKRRYQDVTTPPNPQSQINMFSRYIANAFGVGLNMFFQQFFPNRNIPAQDLSYCWDAGRLITVTDTTNGIDESYGYDNNNRRITLTVKKHDGTLLQSVETRYDARSAVTYAHDGMFVAFTYYDLKGNRRNVLAQLYANGKKLPDFTNDLWYTYNEADAVIISGGKYNPATKTIGLDVNHGIQYGYDKGQRRTQLYKDGRNPGGITVTIHNYSSGLVSTTNDQNFSLTTSHTYDNDYRELTYTQTNPPGMKVSRITSQSKYLPDTGFIWTSDSVQTQPHDDTRSITTHTRFSGWNGSGQPTSQVVANTYETDDDTVTVTDTLTIGLLGADDWKTSYISGVRERDDKQSDIAVASTHWDSNWNIYAQTGLVDPDNQDNDEVKSVSYYYTTSPTGHPIDKTCVQTGSMPFMQASAAARKSRYFIDANTNILGMYEIGLNNAISADSFFDAIAQIIKYGRDFGQSREMGFDAGRGGWVTQKDFAQLTVLDPVQPIGLLWMSRHGYMLNGRYGSDINSSLQGSIAWQHSNEYVVAPGDDSFATISARLFDGDPSYGALIAAYNGRLSSQDSLAPDQKIRVPMFIPAHNNYQINMNYIRFMSVIVEHLYPALKTPQPDTNWFEVIVLTIAVVVAAIVAPEIVGVMAPEIVAALGGEVLASVIVGATIGAVLDAAGQGVLIGIGLEDHFSWDDVLEAAIGGGLGAGMGAGGEGGGLFNPGTQSKIFNAIIQKGMANITHQLIELSLGKQSTFDFKSLLASVGNAAFNAKVNLPVDPAVAAAYPAFSKAVQMAFTDVTNTFVTSAVTQHAPDIRSVSAQMLGNQLGTYIGSGVAEYIHYNYTTPQHQAQYIFVDGHDRPRPVQPQPIILPAPVASKISQKESQAQNQKLSQQRSATPKNIKQLHQELNKDSIETHEMTQSNMKLIMGWYEQGEKSANSIFNSNLWQQNDDVLQTAKLMALIMMQAALRASPARDPMTDAKFAYGVAKGGVKSIWQDMVSLWNHKSDILNSVSMYLYDAQNMGVMIGPGGFVMPDYNIERKLAMVTSSDPEIRALSPQASMVRMQQRADSFVQGAMDLPSAIVTGLKNEYSQSQLMMSKGDPIAAGEAFGPLTGNLISAFTPGLFAKGMAKFGLFSVEAGNDANLFYHTVTSSKGGQGLLSGVDPRFLSADSRFAQALYLSEVPDTTLAELAAYNKVGTHTIRYQIDNQFAKILDLTDPKVRETWGYQGGRISPHTQNIGSLARESGYNIIRYPSERGLGANIAVLNDFDSLLSPQMIVPTPKLDTMVLHEEFSSTLNPGGF